MARDTRYVESAMGCISNFFGSKSYEDLNKNCSTSESAQFLTEFCSMTRVQFLLIFGISPEIPDSQLKAIKTLEPKSFFENAITAVNTLETAAIEHVKGEINYLEFKFMVEFMKDYFKFILNDAIKNKSKHDLIKKNGARDAIVIQFPGAKPSLSNLFISVHNR